MIWESPPTCMFMQIPRQPLGSAGGVGSVGCAIWRQANSGCRKGFGAKISPCTRSLVRRTPLMPLRSSYQGTSSTSTCRRWGCRVRQEGRPRRPRSQLEVDHNYVFQVQYYHVESETTLTTTEYRMLVLPETCDTMTRSARVHLCIRTLLLSAVCACSCVIYIYIYMCRSVVVPL